MDQKHKIEYISIAWLTVVGILSLRVEFTIGLIFGSLGLITIIIYHRSRVALCGLSLILLLLYPGPNIGWLTGRDANLTAYTVTRIANDGWPVTTTLPRAFSETPLMQFHTLVVSYVTGLRWFPRTEPTLLTSFLLPILYTAGSITIAYLISRSKSRSLVTVSLLPIIAWIPLFELRTSFRRQSLGLFLFSISIYLLLKYIKNGSRNRWGVVAILSAFALVATHHLSSFVFLLGLVAVAVGTWRTNVSSGRISLITLFFFATWQFVGGYGGMLTIAVANNYADPTQLSTILDIFGSSGSEQTFPNPVSQPLSTRIMSFVIKWVFAGVIFVGVGFNYLYNREKWINRSIAAFSAIVVSLSAISWLSGTVSFKRLFTFYIILASPFALPALYSAIDRRQINGAKTALAIVFICLGATMVPMHVISTEEPNYAAGETSQRFSGDLYAVGEFVDERYPGQQIIGDDNVIGVVGSMAASRVGISTRPEVMIDGRVPDGSALVYTSYNDRLYFGFIVPRYGGVHFDPPNTPEILNQHSNRIYTNGDISVHINVSTK